MSIKITFARPYAKAAFNEALANDTIAEWSQFLQIAAMVVQQPEVIRILHDPQNTTEQRLSLLLEICESYLDKYRDNFLRLLAKKNRLMLLPEIAELFEDYRTQREKTVFVQITSVMPLNEIEKESLIKALAKRLQSEIVLDCKIDKSLIGGMMIQAGDLVIDGSLMGKLERLSASLTD